MSIYYTSDQHFGHHNIIKYTGRNLWQMADDMNRGLTERWNSVIKEEDTVYCIGDFAPWRDPRRYLRYLSGKKILIKGNHDKVPYTEIDMDNCFLEVYPHLEKRIGQFNCILNHRPQYRKNDSDPYHDSDPNIDSDKYDFIICGHVHQKWKIFWKNYNVGVDVHNFYPISEEELIRELNIIKKGEL